MRKAPAVCRTTDAMRCYENIDDMRITHINIVHFYPKLPEVGTRGIEGKEERKARMTGRCCAPPSRTKGLARLGGGDDHRMPAGICRPRMPQVSTMMATVMAPPAGKRILPWRCGALVATGALGLGGRHQD